MNKILPIGRLQKTDENGYIVNDTDKNFITSPWLEVIEEIKLIYQKYLGEFLHSIYLRGSVARGLAIEKISDIDTLAVTLVDPCLINTTSLEKQKYRLMEKFHFLTGIELEFLFYNCFENRPQYDKHYIFNQKFIIKTQSVCIYGNDLGRIILPFKANIETAKCLAKDLSIAIEDTKNAIKTCYDKAFIAEQCRWIMKLIVRSGFILIMDKVQAFTRDLYPSYKLFSKYFSEQAPKMKMALEWAINPISDSIVLFSFLDDFGIWMHNEMTNKFS